MAIWLQDIGLMLLRHQLERDAASSSLLCCSVSCQQHVNVTHQNRCHHRMLIDVVLLLQKRSVSDSGYKVSALLKRSKILLGAQQLSAACIKQKTKQKRADL